MSDWPIRTITVFSHEKFENDGPPVSLLEFKMWVNKIISEIPEEFKGSARIELDSVSGYEGSHYATVEITYHRPETSEEAAERDEAVAQRDAEIIRREMVKLAELKNKYEKETP